MISSYTASSPASNGASPWLPLWRMEGGMFALGLALIPSSGADLQATVQCTLDRLSKTRTVPWTADMPKTTITIVDADHGMSDGDEISIAYASDAGLDTGDDLTTPITVVDADTYTIGVLSPLSDSSGKADIVRYRVLSHQDLRNKVARSEGNYQLPVMAVRVLVSSWVAGNCDLVVTSLIGR